MSLWLGALDRERGREELSILRVPNDFFRASCGLVFVCMHVQSLCRVHSFSLPRTVAHQAPLSMGFSRQEYWSGLSFPPPGDLPDPGIEPVSSALAGGFFTTEPPGKPSHSLSPSPLEFIHHF